MIKYLDMVVNEHYTHSAAWQKLHPHTKYKNKTSLYASASSAWVKLIDRLGNQKYAEVLKAVGLDPYSIGAKHKQLLDAKKTIFSPKGDVFVVDDNEIQLEALEKALKHTYPQTAGSSGAIIQQNFVIHAPAKQENEDEWEKEAQRVISNGDQTLSKK